jgi:SNF2 family DNA or RNA helicase
MIELFEHQKVGVKFLAKSQSAMLCDSMGLGKTRQALVAAQQLFTAKKIDRVLVLAPAAVRLSWRQEIDKLEADGLLFMPCIYDAAKQTMYGAKSHLASTILPVAVLSYALLPQKRHVEALERWCLDGRTLLVCDESSFLKNRSAKQTKSSARLAKACVYRWLLTGTPIANSPLDLYGQSLVMANGKGPLGAMNWWQFQARYAVLKQMNMGQLRFKQVVGYQNIDELTKRFAPYVLRRTKEECLDLPAKTYVVREVALSEETWRIYNELRKEAMLCLPDIEERPEPNAAVRILRLCQLTSGHVGTGQQMTEPEDFIEQEGGNVGILTGASRDVSSEKLDWLVNEILDGELSSERALIVWCRWRRERERLHDLLWKSADSHAGDRYLFQIYGGQSQVERNESIEWFQSDNIDGVKKSKNAQCVLLAQPHAGGFGLTLTAASTAVYLSNDFSFTTRVQSEDRCHRIGQTKNVTYVDVLAVSPSGAKTIDHHILDCLRAKKSVAELTCSAWRRILS